MCCVEEAEPDTRERQLCRKVHKVIAIAVAILAVCSAALTPAQAQVDLHMLPPDLPPPGPLGAIPDRPRTFHRFKAFVETPPAELARQLPELKHLQPANSQDELPEILSRVGERLKVFFTNFPNTTCSERVTSTVDTPLQQAETHYDHTFNYLVLAKGSAEQKLFQEYRTDDRGQQVSVPDTEGVVTIGFAGAIEYFYPDYQPDSRFRLLGREEIKGQDAYVLAFAQRPERGRRPQILAFGSQRGAAFMQGVAWINAQTYEIVRIRTEILQETGDVDLRQETTEVEYAPVNFKRSDQTLLVPREVTVSGQLGRYTFHNFHRYSDYRIFKVEAVEKRPS